MVSVVRCWKAEYQKCKHSILLYMHSMIPIICAAIFAGYYHISRWNWQPKSVPIWKCWPLRSRF